MFAPSASVLDWRVSVAGSVVEDGAEGDSIALASVANPAAYALNRLNVYAGDAAGEHKMPFAKGTTTLAFKFQGASRRPQPNACTAKQTN